MKAREIAQIEIRNKFTNFTLSLSILESDWEPILLMFFYKSMTYQLLNISQNRFDF